VIASVGAPEGAAASSLPVLAEGPPEYEVAAPGGGSDAPSRAVHPQAAPTPSPPDENVRVHVDWSEPGVRMWLGVDHDRSLPLAEWVRPLVQRLRSWLAAQGTPLLTIVCNGRTVWDRQAAAHAATHTNDLAASESLRDQEEVP
jgi:hypothetical protein